MRKRTRSLLVLVLLLILPVLFTVPYNSVKEVSQLPLGNGWNPDGIPICTANGSKAEIQVCSDGIGGAIMVWRDPRDGWENQGIYVQRIDHNGEIKWIANGIAICTGDNELIHPKICSDGLGGAIIVWEDSRNGEDNYDIYAQRVDHNGSVMWAPNGTVICNAINNQLYPQICSDGTGGAIISWLDNRDDWVSYTDLYVQRINSTGYIQWISNGTAISTTGTTFDTPEICSDGAGGAIITWVKILGAYVNRDIYIQRINSTGDAQWTNEGVDLCSANDIQGFPRACSDDAGGVIVAWHDFRDGWINSNIYAQRVDQNGNIMWASNGIVICNATNDQLYTRLCSDGEGGAIIVWNDNRSGIDYDIYVQRVDYSGKTKWISNGNAICTASNLQGGNQIFYDGLGGAFIFWLDYRDGSVSAGNGDIYTQKVNSRGNIQWLTDGIGLITAYEEQGYFHICSDNIGGVIIAWVGNVIDTIVDKHIYAQHLWSNGYIGGKDDNDDNGDGETISGYNLYILLGLFLSIGFLIVIKRKKFNY